MILLDTHIFLWFQSGNSKLSSQEIEHILTAHRQQTLFLSAISIWEIAMLEKQKRIALHQPIQKWIRTATEDLNVIPISADIALESVLLPNCEHKDPADRLILATARILDLKILSQDEKILSYINLGYV